MRLASPDPPRDSSPAVPDLARNRPPEPRPAREPARELRPASGDPAWELRSASRDPARELRPAPRDLPPELRRASRDPAPDRTPAVPEPASDRPPPELRPGRSADVDPLLTLLDDVVAWLVARGRSGQWGAAPPSGNPAFRAEFERAVAAGTLTVAVRAATVVGAVILDPHRPPYVPADLVPPDALWVHTLVTDRTPAGRGAGRLLLDACRTRAAASGAPLALDHWSGSPELAAVYERAGYREVGTVVVPMPSGPWSGTVRVRP